MAGRVAGNVEDLEAGDLVALAQRAVYVVAGTGAGAEEELGERVVGLALADQLRVLGGVGVASPTQNGIAERSQTGWLAPWWSGWAWVSAWAESWWPFELA